jgi:tetratricopeptide (TPR) repeat protein
VRPRAVSGDEADRDARARLQARAGRDVHAAARDPAAIDQGADDAGRPRPQGGRAWGAATGQVVVGDIPREPPGFLPRESLLAELDRVGQVSVVHAVAGMRGVGKSQLAAAYARARLAEGWRLVAWVNAEDAGNLLGGMAAVAEAAGMSNHGTGQGSGGDAGQVVRHQLEVDGDRCLIVFDNASDPDLLRPFVPMGGAARVLITSNRHSVANLGTSVSVDVFSPDEALAFLTGRTGLADAAGAAAVAVELGYLPLALAQAAPVIAGQDLRYGRYLDRLRALPPEDYPIEDEGQSYPHGMAKAVLKSLKAIRAGDQGDMCAELMEVMAVLSAAGVRRDLLHVAGQAGVPASGVRRAGVGADLVDRALERLAKRSLLTVSLDGQTLIAHRLVMLVVRDGLARQGRLTTVCRAAASVLDARARALKGSQDRSAVRDIPKQVAALRDTIAGSADAANKELAELLLSLRFWAVYHLNELGESTSQAIVVGEQLVADFEQALGPDHPDTLNSRNSLAIAYQDAGRAAEAIALHEQALAAFERALGPDHPSTLASRNNLAIAYREAGRTAEAIALHEQALAVYERVRVPDHPDILASRNHLAAAYREAGRAAEAIALYEQTLAAHERVWGHRHPRTLASRGSLAKAYREAGRAAEAIALYEQTLAARERMLGPDHRDTLGSRNNLANSYRAAGRAAEAIVVHEQTLAAYERMLGPDHPDTLGSRNNLANAYRDAGLTAEAIVLHEQTLAAREHVLGPDHPDTLRSRNNLAHAYRDAGRTAEAIALQEQALAARERVLGPDHPSTLASRNDPANAYQQAGQVDQASTA